MPSQDGGCEIRCPDTACKYLCKRVKPLIPTREFPVLQYQHPQIDALNSIAAALEKLAIAVASLGQNGPRDKP